MAGGRNHILDTITRTYTNAAGDVIAKQYIAIRLNYIDGLDGAGRSLVTQDSINATRFRRTGDPQLSTVMSPKSGASTTVSAVVTSGSFNSRSESANDVVTVTYTGSSSDENDLIIPVNALGGVFKIGDVL